MNISVIAFSKCGAELAVKVISGLSNRESEIKGYISQRHAAGTDFEPFSSVYEIAAGLFDNTDALIFIGACGIAVRAVAPLIKSKMTDPAVVVCDETGQFAISLLSGHLGGANELAITISKITGARAVITTASDAHANLDKEPREQRRRAFRNAHAPSAFRRAVFARRKFRGESQPKNLILGIGCRRGVSAEAIERAATILLWDEKIPLAHVCGVATIDIKRDEKGLVDFAAAHKFPLHFFSAAELSGVAGEFSSSERVLQAVGVDNVCERAAVLCGGKGKLIKKKTAKDGVTVAVFERE